MLQRWLRLGLLLLILLTNLPLAGTSAWAAEANTAGQYAATFSGERPPANPGDLDLSGYVQVPFKAGLNSNGGALTIEAWVKRMASNRNETVVGNGYHTSYWLGFGSNGKLRFFPHGNGSGVDSNAVVPAGVWTHIAVTYDGLTRRYYINGVLDSTSTTNAGPITPAPNGQPLGIGFDADDDFTPNYFGGDLDQVRIWKTVRSGALLKAGMFQSYGSDPNATLAGLLAEWRLDGDASDATGHYNGLIKGSVNFGSDAAIPHDIRVPQVNNTLTLDGDCSSAEYAAATVVGIGGATVALLHTATDLWACFNNLDKDNTRATLYLDADHSRSDPAQTDDLALSVLNDNTTQTQAGDGDSSYTATNAADGKWAGQYHSCCGEFPTNSAEFRLSADLLGGWNHMIGLALGQANDRLRQSGQLWPALAERTLPSTWSNGNLGGVGAPRTFTGSITYQPKDDSAAKAIPGVAVTLIGIDGNGSEAPVATAQSGFDGAFNLTSTDDYSNHRLELESSSLPPGYQVVKATAPAPAVVVDARTLEYAAAAASVYNNINFTLGDDKPFVLDSANGPYFLILAPQAIIDSGALTDFVDYKFRLGFQVEVTSLESLNAPLGSLQLRDKIRQLEQDRRQSVGSRFQYVLLVGPHSVIPFPKLYIGTTNKDGNSCMAADQTKVSWKYSDWYFVDLTSNFDSNGNGCLADGILAKQADLAAGYTPDSGISFALDVTVGRLPYTKATTVRTVLENSMLFEQSTDVAKTKALMGMSMVALKGQYYDEDASMYKDCGGDQWSLKCVGPSDNNSRSYDLAHLGEAMKSDFLNSAGFSSTWFYETVASVAGGAGFATPKPLSEPNMIDALKHNNYGLVHVDGHGNSSGVYRYYWGEDANHNNKVEATYSPADSNTTGGSGEIVGNSLLTLGAMNGVPSKHGYGSIFILGACSTGSPDNPDNMGATLLANGYGVGWVGGLNIVTVGSWFKADDGNIQTLTYYVTKLLLHNNLRMGDAVWQTLRQGIQKKNYGSGVIAVDLYGDPTLSYWGNPGGQSTLAAWPMQRQDAFGRGFVTLNGPGLPKTQWSYNATAPAVAALPPSPVVSKLNEVIVAHGNFVDVLVNGVRVQRLNLDGPAYGSAAIAADGTLYALDTAGKLYAFAADPDCLFNCQFVRARRWALALGHPPLSSPVIGADGFIAVAHGSSNSFVAAVRPDGVKFREALLTGEVTGGLAVSADRKIYALTNNPTEDRWRIDFFCNGVSGTPSAACQSSSVSSLPSNNAYSTAPLLAYGAIYGGRNDGTVEKLTLDTLAIQKNFKADSQITLGPVTGPGGQVLVGSANGTLYSLTKDLSLRWQRNVGATQSIPAFSLDALYLVRGDKLWAYHPHSGATLWSKSLGAGAGNGSAAVGYGRMVYAQTSSGKVVAVGEGWSNAPINLSAKPTVIETRPVIAINWLAATLPLSLTTDLVDAAQVQATNSTLGYLLQRSGNGGPWEDVATLPPGTTAFSDTNVLHDVTYRYRMQVLDATGNDSDFVTSAAAQSMPDLPQAPTLDQVSTLAADALALTWHSPTNDVVTGYRIERSPEVNGPFSGVIQSTGESTNTVDVGLTADTTYFYRVVALNATGESLPSNVVSSKTRQRTLPAPQKVVVTLLAGDEIQVTWSGAPAGANAVVEVTNPGVEGYAPLAITDATGNFTYAPGEVNSYGYRVKFVQGDAESNYTVAMRGATIVDAPVIQQALYLPVVVR